MDTYKDDPLLCAVDWKLTTYFHIHHYGESDKEVEARIECEVDMQQFIENVIDKALRNGNVSCNLERKTDSMRYGVEPM